MAQSQIEQPSPPGNEDLEQRWQALEQATRLAELAAQSHAAREDRRRAARTVAEERRTVAVPRRLIGAQDEIASLKNELEQAKDAGMHYAATAVRLSGAVDELKTELKLAQERMLEARRDGELADAQHQEAQHQITVLQAELARMRDELAAQHSSLAQVRQAAHAQVEEWTAEVHSLREELHALNTQFGETQRLHHDAQGQIAALQSTLDAERIAAEALRKEAETAQDEAERRAVQLQTALDQVKAHATVELDEVRAVAQCEQNALQARLADQQQEAQAALTRADEQLAHYAAEIAALHERLGMERQLEQSPSRFEREAQQLRDELERAQQEIAHLRDKWRAFERDLERAHVALQEKDRELNDALLLVNLTESAAKPCASDLHRRPSTPLREWRTRSNAQGGAKR